MSVKPDVIIIGGGIIGLSIAWFLANQGASVTVLERGSPGSGASGAAAGMLAPFAESEHGGAFVNLGQRSLEMYDSFIDEINNSVSISIVNNSPGLLRVATDQKEFDALKGLFDNQQSSIHHFRLLDAQEIRQLEPHLSQSIIGGLHSPLEKQIDPRTLCHALSLALQNQGVRILEHCNVTDIQRTEDKAVSISANGQQYSFENLVIAGGAWTTELGDYLGVHLPVKPIKGQILSLQTETNSLSHTIYGSKGYIVPRSDGRIVIGATVEDVGFDLDVDVNGILQLIVIGQQYLQDIGSAKVLDSWAGLRPASPDGMPILGKVPTFTNAFVATGHYRNGILLAPVTGKLIADLTLNRVADALLQPFSPDRFAN